MNIQHLLFNCIWLLCLSLSNLYGQSQLQNGDLLFVKASSGNMSEAISEATSHNGERDFDHVAIVYLNNQKCFVIEATPKLGVVCRPYHDFASDCDSDNIVVMRYTAPMDFQKVIRKALSFVGKAYDFTFLPDNQELYCSELIYLCYTDSVDKPVFKSKPMNFRASDGTMPEYWTQLFKSLNKPIPEGVLGTNPNDLSRDKRLQILFFQ